MAYSFFAGCKIPHFLPEYSISTLALLNRFGIKLLDLEFNCCGYPVRDIDFQSFLFSGAWNLALSERQNADIVTPCMCCFGSLKFVEYYLKHHQAIKDQINAMLRPEGLQWEGRITVNHLLTVLHRDVGLDVLQSAVVNPYQGLKVAIQAGCHALRPSNVTQFDNPMIPRIFNDLVALTGAESVFWSMGTECCGYPQWDKNQKLSVKQMQRKLQNAKQAEADIVCTACTHCQIQFEQKNRSEFVPQNDHKSIPSVLVSQLIGLSVGLEAEQVCLGDDNRQKLMSSAGLLT